MGIVLGFGSTEAQKEKLIRKEVLKALLFNDDVQSVAKKWKSQAEIYDKMPREEAPERYTYFYFYDNAIHFHHINRRHPFSPDGWALLCVEMPIKFK